MKKCLKTTTFLLCTLLIDFLVRVKKEVVRSDNIYNMSKTLKN